MDPEALDHGVDQQSRPALEARRFRLIIQQGENRGRHDRDLHFHDLRGTAATRFYAANIPQRAIAEIMGWEEEHVARLMRRYVGRSVATQAIIRQINEARGRT